MAKSSSFAQQMREGMQSIRHAAGNVANNTHLANASQTSHAVQQRAGNAVARPWYAAVARTGFVAKGVVYIVIGWLAVETATHAGGATPDQRSALLSLYAQPFGKVLLAIVGLGLLAYAVTSFIRAAIDPEHEGHDAKGTATRIGNAVIGVTYTSLGIGALQLALFAHASTGVNKGSNATTQDYTARLLAAPAGVALVTLVGLIVAGAAIALAYQAISGHFTRNFSMEQMSAITRRVVTIVGRCGLLALSVVLAIVALFLLVAAWQHNPGQAKGLSGALATLAQQPFGPALLVVVALGLFAYGIYSFAEARYRRVN
ncbi:MAG: DUF1206 domain-containing protein [Ktedonobacterales bacterium]